VNPSKLPNWTLNSGSAGGSGPLLALLEYDGYLTIRSMNETVSVPWHILPHKAADNHIVQNNLTVVNNAGSFLVSNNHGAKTGVTELFALTGTSAQDYPETLPWGSNLAAPDLAAVGVRTITNSGGIVQFAIATYDQRAHANYPLEVDIYVDSNNDGTDDFVIYNTENGGFAVSGQNVTRVVNLTNNAAATYYFTDADLNSSALIMNAPMSALRMTAGAPIRFSVYLFDNYFTGNATDGVENMLFTGGKPRFAVSSSTVEVPATQIIPVNVTYDSANDEASASQTGILGIHRDASPGRWYDVLRVKPQ
jgi:minor extracellular serine protease Vpr